MEILIHIGRPKTGTTSLQRFLYRNREALSTAGYFLLNGAGRPNNVEIPAYFDRTASVGLATWRRRRGIATVEEKAAYFDKLNFPEILCEEIRSATGRHGTAIITSEHLSSCLTTDEEIRSFSAWVGSQGDSVRVVGFARDQVAVLPSGWSTAVRSGGVRGLSERVDAALSRRSLDYFHWATLWAEAFGPANTDFHVYPPDPSWDIRRFFAERYLPAATGLRFPAERSNLAYGRIEAELVRTVNYLWPCWRPGNGEVNPINERGRKIASRLVAGRDIPLRLSSRQARRVRAAFAQSNARFISQYLPHYGEL